MEVKFIERGKYKGNIDVPGTLRTMKVADKWVVEPSVVNFRSIRNVCSKMRASGLSFSVHVPGYSEPNITIVRNRVTNKYSQNPSAMDTSYFIFKTDNLSGKTINICNGSHDSEHECNIHFHAYMYGFYDGCVEALGSGKFQFGNGTRKNSFRFSVDGKLDVEYFMLLDQAGHDLIVEISKAEANQ